MKKLKFAEKYVGACSIPSPIRTADCREGTSRTFSLPNAGRHLARVTQGNSPFFGVFLHEMISFEVRRSKCGTKISVLCNNYIS